MPAVRARSAVGAVICLLSRSWETSRECQVEYLTAENLNKQILCARLAECTGQDLTSQWQRVEVFGAGPHTCIEVRRGLPMLLATKGPIRLRTRSAGRVSLPRRSCCRRRPIRIGRHIAGGSRLNPSMPGWSSAATPRWIGRRRRCDRGETAAGGVGPVRGLQVVVSAGRAVAAGSAAKTAVSCRWALCARSACS